MTRSVVLYDAGCPLCRMWKAWIESGTFSDCVHFANARDKDLAEQLGVRDLGQLDRRMCLLEPDGRAHWGFDAVVALLAERPSTEPIADVLRHPFCRKIGRWVYDKVSANRKWISP